MMVLLLPGGSSPCQPESSPIHLVSKFASGGAQTKTARALRTYWGDSVRVGVPTGRDTAKLHSILRTIPRYHLDPSPQLVGPICYIIKLYTHT